jgi:phage N-6-adenine-methyltransferase|tara:strand:- start:981 stop:1466 length:486 start_codon:yes stop_codon:yes gene_type:complete
MDKTTQDAMFSSKSLEWATPQHFFDQLEATFGEFTLDPCTNDSNYKVKNRFTETEDGLKQDWSGNKVFMNPPYGRVIKHWIKKAYEEGQKEETMVVALIPARTDTRYWHDYVMKAHAIYFVKGRLKFGNGENSAPFPSAVIVFKKEKAQRDMPQLGVMLVK